MNSKDFGDLLAAQVGDLELAAVEGLRSGNESLLERVDQALHMRFLYLQDDAEAPRAELSRLLERIIDSPPAREVVVSAAQRRVTEWEHLHTLLDIAEAAEDPLVEARRFITASTYGEAILDCVRDSPLLKKQLMERVGIGSEASLSQILGKMEARGLVCREAVGREVEVALGWLGEKYLRPTLESWNSQPIVSPSRAESAAARPSELFAA